MQVLLVLILLGLAASLIHAWGPSLLDRLRPTRRAIRRARLGQLDRAIADLEARRQRKPASAAVRGALGRVYLMAQRPADAEVELRQALELGGKDPAYRGALGWALVAQERFDEALTLAEDSIAQAREDYDAYCLYCGLMARQGRTAEVAQLRDFLERSAIQLERQDPETFAAEWKPKLEFARSRMETSGPPPG